MVHGSVLEPTATQTEALETEAPLGMLLDTHAWLWSATNDARHLGARAARAIEHARKRGALLVSVASMLEIASLAAAGRLALVPTAETWMRQSIELGAIRVAEVTATIAIDAGSIPPSTLPDPMDRLLVATARAWAVPLVTRDAAIRAYADATRSIRVLDVSR